jgi:hypothetical protein
MMTPAADHDIYFYFFQLKVKTALGHSASQPPTTGPSMEHLNI